MNNHNLKIDHPRTVLYTRHIYKGKPVVASWCNNICIRCKKFIKRKHKYCLKCLLEVTREQKRAYKQKKKMMIFNV